MARRFDRFMIEVELASNPKIGRFDDREFRCILTGVWALAAKAKPRGYLLVGQSPATASDVAFQARCSVPVAERTLEKMRALGMLECEDAAGWEHVHDWQEINPEPRPDPTNAERQARHRARRNGPGNGPGNGGSNGSRNGPVTASNAGEVEVEVEVEEQPSANADGVAAAPPRDQSDIDSEELCHLMSHHVRTAHGIDPASKEARVTKGWRDACRAMLTLDGYTREQIAYAIEWACRHHYWRNRVKSMTRLRSEMTQVVKEIREQRERGGQVVPLRKESAGDLIDAMRGAS